MLQNSPICSQKNVYFLFPIIFSEHWSCKIKERVKISDFTVLYCLYPYNMNHHCNTLFILKLREELKIIVELTKRFAVQTDADSCLGFLACGATFIWLTAVMDQKTVSWAGINRRKLIVCSPKVTSKFKTITKSWTINVVNR